jgi:hypothetical protein
MQTAGLPVLVRQGSTHGQSVFTTTREKDKARARRFKDELEIGLARSAGQKCHAATFREAAALYLEFRRPHRSFELGIGRLCAVIGDRLLVDVRQRDLGRVDSFNPKPCGCNA